MLHYDVPISDGGLDCSRTVQEALQAGISVSKTQFFDTSLNLMLQKFAHFVTSLLQKQFPNDSDINMTPFFGLEETGASYHGELHCVSHNASQIANEMWKVGSLARESWKLGYTLFIPLFQEGMALRILHHTDENEGVCDPTMYTKMFLGSYKVSFGSCLLIRNDVMHSGCYGSVGSILNNTRLFCTLYPRSGLICDQDREKFIGKGYHDDVRNRLDPLALKKSQGFCKKYAKVSRYAKEYENMTGYNKEYHDEVLKYFRGSRSEKK
ncbi:MAG: hypothetical protein SGILL_003037 [Bacillariaceae sp.]